MNPLGNADLIAISALCVSEPFVGAKELDDFFAARAEFGAEVSEIAAGERPNPSPVSAQGLACAGYEVVFRRLASEHGASQCRVESGSGHGRRTAKRSNESDLE